MHRGCVALQVDRVCRATISHATRLGFAARMMGVIAPLIINAPGITAAAPKDTAEKLPMAVERLTVCHVKLSQVMFAVMNTAAVARATPTATAFSAATLLANVSYKMAPTRIQDRVRPQVRAHLPAQVLRRVQVPAQVPVQVQVLKGRRARLLDQQIAELHRVPRVGRLLAADTSDLEVIVLTLHKTRSHRRYRLQSIYLIFGSI
jgi:hypothetical protein